MADETKAAKAAKTKVYVRSVPRPGFGGSYRLGRHWSSQEFAEFEGTPDEVRQLIDDPLLMVFDRKPRLTADGRLEHEVHGDEPSLQAGAPPGTQPPPEVVHKQGPGDAPVDTMGVNKPKGR